MTFAELYKNWSMKKKYKWYGINKIGYLDIETSGLVGDFDIMLSYAILVRDVRNETTSIRKGVIKKNDFDVAIREKNADLIDRRLTEQLVGDIQDLDLLIGHWFIGKHRHDMPFIRTRCAINKVEGLPKHRQIRYGDTQKWGSVLYRLHNFGLDSLSDMYGISIQKTHLKPKIWKNACIGVKEALDYILDHNIKDVKLTYRVHKGMEKYVPIASTYY